MDDWAGKNWDRRRMADGWPRAPCPVPRAPWPCDVRGQEAPEDTVPGATVAMHNIMRTS